MHWSVYSAVVGTVLFAYIRLFVQNMSMYTKSEYTLTWGQFVDRTLELQFGQESPE